MTAPPEPLAFQVPPIVKRVRLALSREEAFERFTSGMAGWWPLASHSVCGAEAATCAIEGRPGGRIVERSKAGDEHLWGIVERWAPPGELALRWFAGGSESEAQQVCVRFEEIAPRLTEVVLTHSGWERLGRAAEAPRAAYDRGWDVALARFAEHDDG